jgi:hypothetical protein
VRDVLLNCLNIILQQAKSVEYYYSKGKGKGKGKGHHHPRTGHEGPEWE